MKRFYTNVAVGPAVGAFTVLLDARPVRTPARHILALPTEALAAAVADEWRSQDAVIDAKNMPLTKLATTVVDLMPARRADAIEEVANFAGTDLLCYRATGPALLVARQAAAWQPWLDWAERQYDARLVPVQGIMPMAQDETVLRALRRTVERLDDWRLVGVHAATTLLGSLILALAMERGALGGQEAFEVALLDELFELEQWGPDEEQAKRHARLMADAQATERFLQLLPR